MRNLITTLLCAAIVSAALAAAPMAHAQQMLAVNDSVVVKQGYGGKVRTVMSKSAMFAFVDKNDPDENDNTLPELQLGGFNGDEIFEWVVGKATPRVLDIVWLRIWKEQASTLDGVTVYVWVQYIQRDLTEPVSALPKKGK